MMPILHSLMESLILASTCSADAFAVSFGYGSEKIKIPPVSGGLIALISGLTFGASLLGGAALRPFLPDWLTKAICFAILLSLGAIKLLDSAAKAIIRRHNKLRREIRFSLFHFRVILHLCANPEAADADQNKVLSPKEAFALSLSLSLDGIAAGFGAALGAVHLPAAFIASLAANALCLLLGYRLGNALSGKLSFNLSWVTGAVLIALAFIKLLG